MSGLDGFFRGSCSRASTIDWAFEGFSTDSIKDSFRVCGLLGLHRTP